MLVIAKHRQVMFNILKAIYRTPHGAYLGFKGGTMAYFFYGLDRFSVDLDFDLLPGAKKEEVFGQVKRIISQYGKIEEAVEKKYTLFFLLNYEKTMVNLKIEISKRVVLMERYTLASFYGTDVRIMKEEEAFTEKLAACLGRKRMAIRDFYDTWFYLSKGTGCNFKLLAELTGMKGTSYLEKLIKYIEKNLAEKNILAGIGELVSDRQKYWIKNNLKRELLERLSFFKEETEKVLR